MDDDHGGVSGASDLSLEDLIDEYSSRPPQIAEWLWCIEYEAKFVKDLRCILDLMNIGYQYSSDYGRRINEVLSLRILEFMFDTNDDATGVCVPSTSEEKVEFDLSLSNVEVLRTILKEISVTELRVGMPELSKFNLVPFIAHKNVCLPQCALEKLRDVCLMEDQTSAAASMEANDPVFRDDRSVHTDTCEEEPIDDQQVHIGLEENVNEKDQVIAIDDENEPVHTNENDEVIMVDGDTESDQDITGKPINNGNTTDENTWPEDAPVKCTNAASSMEANDPVFRDDRSVHTDTCEEEPIDDQQVHIGLEENVNEKDQVIAIDDEDEPVHTNEKDEVIMVDGDTESDQDITGKPINNGNTTDENTWPEDAPVKFTKDGTLLISGSDDESDMVKDPTQNKKNPNTYKNLLPSSSRTRPENVCWKCKKEGTLLICSRSECAAKVHKECLNCPVNVDEDGNFLCPLCWLERVTAEYHESQKLMSFAKRKLVKCFPILSTRSKRLK